MPARRYFRAFFIEEYRFRSDSTALVKLEGIDTAERARMFTNIEVYFPVKHAEEAEDGGCPGTSLSVSKWKTFITDLWEK